MVDLEKWISRVVKLVFIDESIGLIGTENSVYLQGGWHPVSPYIVSILVTLKKTRELEMQ